MSTNEASSKTSDNLDQCFAAARHFLDDTLKAGRETSMQDKPAARIIVATWDTLLEEMHSTHPVENQMAGVVALLIAHLMKSPMENDEVILADMKAIVSELRYRMFCDHVHLVRAMFQSLPATSAILDENTLAASLVLSGSVAAGILQVENFASSLMHILFSVAMARCIKQLPQ